MYIGRARTMAMQFILYEHIRGHSEAIRGFFLDRSINQARFVIGVTIWHKLTQWRLVWGSRNAICIQNWVGKAFNSPGRGVVDVLRCFFGWATAWLSREFSTSSSKLVCRSVYYHFAWRTRKEVPPHQNLYVKVLPWRFFQTDAMLSSLAIRYLHVLQFSPPHV